MPRVAVLFDNSVRPETTGFYVRRALGQMADVEHFLPGDFDSLARGGHGRFDLYLAVDDGLEYRLPASLRPLAFWAIDTHVSFPQVLAKASVCDHVFAAQKDGAEKLRRAGIDAAVWLPLACDPEIHKPHPIPRCYDVAFVGHVFPGPREELLRWIEGRFPRTFIGRRYLEEMAEVYSAARIGFNRSLANDINMRVFEVLSCGSLLVTNAIERNGQDELFENGVHLVTYSGAEDLLEKIGWHLDHARERERIAAEGRRAAIERHTYRIRMETLLQHVEQARRTTVAVGSAAGAKDRGYFEFSRPEVLALIPTTARSVLDIGCGGGRLGAALKRRQPARVVGIELDPNAASAARARLDEVVRANLEQDPVEFETGRFDCVVCADVLEHLRHPERLLANVRRWLAPEGCLVASIPNIRHHTVLTSLLAGNFTYEPAGLLDDTHVRFFTRREIEKLLFRSGFHVERMQSVAGPGDGDLVEAAQRGEVRAGRLKITGLDPAEAAEFHTYQYLLVARPTRRGESTPEAGSDANEAAWRRLVEQHPWPERSPEVPVPETHLGWFGDGARAALGRAVRADTRCIVELGTWLGESARAMARLAPEAQIVCVDHWEGSAEHVSRPELQSILPQLYETFLTRCWDLRERLLPLRMTVQEGLRRIAEAGLQPEVIYFDADHTTAAVLGDLTLARQLFPGARLVGDDYSAPEVAAAVDAFAREHGGTLVTFGTAWKAWELRLSNKARTAGGDDGLTSIVLVTHNQLDYTRLCLESVRFRTDEPYELIVVDNGSTDGTPDYLRGCSDVRLIENSDNQGFPAAANQGIAVARGDQILLLNNDTVVTTGWLRRMLDALRSDRRVGLVGPLSNQVSGSQQIPVSYEQLGDLDGFAWDLGRSQRGQVEEVDRLVGFCLLAKRQVIGKIGGLDERFGIGNFEDDDYCRRVIRAGFRCVIARDAFVHHFGGRTFIASGVDYGRLLAENERKYCEKWSRSATARFQEAGGDRGDDGSSRNGRPETSREVGLVEAASHPIRLSLCMIVRDNERTIVQCLESIRPWVDEMIVVDTGSKDATPELCRNLGAKVLHFPWCDDFSEARNESLRHATGEWIFWMDSDDTIPEECGRQLRALADGRHDDQLLGYVMQVYCPSPNRDGTEDVTVVDHVKLFRNRPDLRFEHRIHEQILPAIRRAGGEVAFTEIHVVHSGSDHTPEGRKRKLERDFRLLELDAAERPDHPFVLFNLGMTYADAENHEEAVRALNRCLAVSTSGESHVRKCYALLVSTLSQADQNEDAWNVCAEGLLAHPDDKELLFREALLHHHFGRLPEAENSYRRVLNEAAGRHFSSSDQGISGYKARHNLAIVLEEQGKWAEAEMQWRAIIEERSEYPASWRGLGELLLVQGREDEVSQIVDLMEACAPLHRDGCLLRARLEEVRGDTQRARKTLEAARTRFPGDDQIVREFCRLLFERFDLREAAPHLEQLIALDPKDAAALHNLGTVHLQGGHPERAVVCFLRSLRIRPISPNTALSLGQALRECGRPDEAVRAWREGLRLSPDSRDLREALEAYAER